MIDTKRIIDISLALNEKTVVWTDDAQPELKPLLRTPADPVNFTWLSFGSHAGTHVDAPFFLYEDGWTADQIPFDRLVGKCQVLDLSGLQETIRAEDLKDITITENILLLKTANSFDPMVRHNARHVDMTVEAAEVLVSKGVRTLAYDYLSFERDGRNEVHEVFLSRAITVIDNVRLAAVEAGIYFLVCLPIKLTGTDGAPCRAILLEQS